MMVVGTVFKPCTCHQNLWFLHFQKKSKKIKKSMQKWLPKVMFLAPKFAPGPQAPGERVGLRRDVVYLCMHPILGWNPLCNILCFFAGWDPSGSPLTPLIGRKTHFRVFCFFSMFSMFFRIDFWIDLLMVF